MVLSKVLVVVGVVDGDGVTRVATGELGLGTILAVYVILRTAVGGKVGRLRCSMVR